MTLTLTSLGPIILQTSDLGALPVEFSIPMVVNWAGRWLGTVQSWKWLTRTGTIAATPSSNSVSLASFNLTAVQGVWYTTNLSYRIILVDLTQISDMRATYTLGGPPCYCALATSESSGVLTRSLEFNTDFTAADSLTIQYTAGFIDATGSIPVPPEFEMIFIQACRAYVRGLVEEDEATLDQRLAVLANCDEMMRLRRQDAMSQRRVGPLRGGGVEREMMNMPDPKYPRTQLYTYP